MKRVLEYKIRVIVEDHGKPITQGDRDFMGFAIDDAVNSYAKVGELSDPERPLEVVSIGSLYPSRSTVFKE